MSFVEAHRDRFAAGLLCQVLSLSTSTYDERRPRGVRSRPSARAAADAGLLHSALGYLSPEQYEQHHEQVLATAGAN